MRASDYCQNLWAQYRKLEKLLSEASDLMEIMKKSGPLDTFEDVIKTADIENKKLAEVWESCLEELPDRRKLWKPDYNVLLQLISDNQDPGGMFNYIDMERLLGGIEIDPDNCSVRSISFAKVHISNPEAITQLARLKSLNMDSYLKKDLSFLKRLGGLEEFSCQTAVSGRDWSPLSSLIHLRKLNLGNSTIKNIQFITGLTQIEELRLFSARCSDLSAIGELKNLRTLDIGGLRPSGLKRPSYRFLAKLQKIEDLELYNAHLTEADMNVLLGLPNLKSVQLNSVKITEKPKGRDLARKLKNKGVDVKGIGPL